MTNRQEVKVQTRGPDRGNPTPRRQERWPGYPGPRRASPQWANGSGPARECLVEVIGVHSVRIKVKRRKASGKGEPASSGEARSLSAFPDVVATGGAQSLLVLPEAFCRVPRER